MVSAGTYVLGAALLVALILSLAFAAHRLRTRLLPAWDGAPGLLVDSILAISLLIWLSELLGIFSLLYAGTLVASGLLTAAAIAWRSRPSSSTESAPPTGGGGGGGPRSSSPTAPPSTSDRTRGPGWIELSVMVGVIAIVVAHWGLTIDSALDRGIFNFDSLWYHMPFAADIAQSHSVTGIHYNGAVFANWFYPQNSELLHATGILLTHRDTLSLFLNLGWLAIAFLAAWAIGRPYGRGHLSVAAVAILLECHTLVVREPGAAKNDLATAAPLLAAIAILVTAWSLREGAEGERGSLPPGWPLAAAGLAAGLAAGTKFTAFAIAAALSVAVIWLAPAGRRRAAAAWWFLPALAAGGFWYLRNLIVSGNPLPVVAHVGPITLPHPEGLHTLRPDFSIAHYATDTGVWRHYFAPGLHDQFGALWPLVLFAALLGAVAALALGRDRVVRWIGGIALFGMAAYAFTPLSAAGAEGAPVAFAINLRYLVPSMLIALALLPLPRVLDDRRRQWGLLAALVAVLLLTDRSDAVLRDPSRAFGLALAALLVLVPAGLLALHARGASRNAIAAGSAALALAVLALGYPVQRHYLEQRFLNEGPADERIPGMGLNAAYRWARGTEDARIGVAGSTAGFLQYGLFGRDLSNRVLYLGETGPHEAFTPIPTCAAFRAAVNAADLEYLVTSPFLNFIDTGNPISSPEAGWLRGSQAVSPLSRNGDVTVWRIRGRLDPEECRAPLNAPLRRIPKQPEGA